MATVKALHIAIGAKTDGFRRGLKRSQNDLSSFKSKVAGVGAGIAKGFAVGAAGIAAVGTAIGLATRSFAGFESGMLRVQAVSGATAHEMKVLTAQAEQLGATTAFSAKQAAEGMGFLGQAGFKAAEIQAAMPSVLNLAAAGAMELADAADITSTVLRGFGLQASEATNVADVLAKAAASSNTSVQEMGEGFKFVGPVASAMGISIEETAAALSVLSDAGLKGSLAGTGLRQALVKLGPDIIAQGGLLPALKALDSEGIAAVTAAMDNLGARAGTAAIALANNTGRAEELRESYQNAGGSAQEMADTMMSGVTGAGLEVKSAFEAVVNSVGKAFGPFTIGLLDGVAKALQMMSGVATNLGETFGLTEEDGKAAFMGIINVLETLAIAGSHVVDVFRAGFLGVRIVIGSVLSVIVAGITEMIALAQMAAEVLGFDETAAKLQAGVNFAADVRDELAKGVEDDMDTMGGLFQGTEVKEFFKDLRGVLDGSVVTIEEPPQLEVPEAIKVEAPPELEAAAAEVADPEKMKSTAASIQTVLGAVKVDAGAAKKDSDNLEKIAKATTALADRTEEGAFV